MTELEPIGQSIARRRNVPMSVSAENADLSAKDQLVLALVEIGIGLRKAEYLVATFPAGRIKRQIEWLPLRFPKRPAPLLIAAIERDYDAPAYAGR